MCLLHNEDCFNSVIITICYYVRIIFVKRKIFCSILFKQIISELILVSNVNNITLTVNWVLRYVLWSWCFLFFFLLLCLLLNCRFSQGLRLRQVDMLQEGITGSFSTLTKLAYRLRGVCKSAIKRMKRRGDLKIGKIHEIVFIDESKFGHKRKVIYFQLHLFTLYSKDEWYNKFFNSVIF